MRRAVALLLLLAPMLVAGAGRGARKSYLRAHDDNTSELVLHYEFSTTLLMSATLLTPSFRTTLSEERRRLRGEGGEDHAAYVERMREDAAAYHEVVFTADQGVPGKLAFGTGDEGWTLRLEADGTVEELVSADRVRKPTPVHRMLYPQVNRWAQLWVARFRRTVERPNTVVLHVGSGWGNGEIVWEDLNEERSR